MQQIDPTQITDNFISLIGKEWMLITAGSATLYNTMTASWGAAGYLWNRPVAFVFVRPERYTFEFMEQNENFSLSFLGKDHRDAYKICGSRSGRDTNKIQEANLHPLTTPSGLVTFKEARLTVECKKIYGSMLQKDHFSEPSIYEQWYGETHGGDHKLYIGAITACFIHS
ncbi:MAG TPA: flavin reductase [Candidatus Alistipes merdigallinarum]|nr:flavin reductase [Candidatus Alistipes merdigallinarum]